MLFVVSFLVAIKYPKLAQNNKLTSFYKLSKRCKLSGGLYRASPCLEILVLMCLVKEVVVSCFSILAMTDAYFGASDKDLTTE